MAAIARHFALWKTGQHFYNTSIARGFGVSAVTYSKKKKKSTTKTGGQQQLQSVAQSLASRGFLRSNQPYTPPPNVASQIQEMSSEAGYGSPSAIFPTLNDKFSFLEECRKKFNYSVPNSLLHELSTVQDVIEFYESPVNTTLPMDTIKTEDLPENLHIQSEYVRFHPEEDTMFGGVSAFPKSSTLVTGVKYRKKYRGHIAKTSWP
uniref:Large ribosomal subunit protein mL50 n=1 Tax=Phlebotomus papatasi TaxID=29031 RepID=A0A1B0DDT5_PHLPP